mmetsp:Transcript_176462/g.560557  ORF Transcript_176462/g.560557 Transcript_176462/m.560557 type:complete len:118 (-) Transcript_176462:1267-1620(-)
MPRERGLRLEFRCAVLLLVGVAALLWAALLVKAGQGPWADSMPPSSAQQASHRRAASEVVRTVLVLRHGAKNQMREAGQQSSTGPSPQHKPHTCDSTQCPGLVESIWSLLGADLKQD